MRHRLVAVAAVLVALGAIYGAGLFSAGSGPAAAGVRAAQGTGLQTAVTSVIRACPPAAPGSGRPGVAVAAIPRAGDLTGIATLAAAGSAKGSQTISAPRTDTLVNAPSASAATTVTASGAMAEGLAAEQANALGIATARCTDPGSDLWFAGTGQGAGAADIRLYLVNTDDLAATVNATLLTDSGVVQNDDFSGITVPPHRTVEESLTASVRGSEVVAVHVQASAGRVAATVWEGAPGDSAGAWLPEAAAPATKLIVPGLSAASSAARLFIVVPGGANAEVKVVALTPQGHFLPFGSGPVNAPADAASEFALGSLGAGAAALELASNVPVTAAVLVPGTGLGAVTAATAPVTEQGVVAGNPVNGGYTTTMVLSAPGAAARVAVSTVPVSSTSDVTVAAGHTVSVTLRAPKGARHSFAVVLTPLAGSGPCYAARVVTAGGAVSSVLPVASALTTIDLPPVRQSYTAVSPLFVAGVDLLGVHAEQLGELLDHHAEHQLGQLVVVLGARHQRTAVQHDARGRRGTGRVGRVRRPRNQPGQRYRE